MLCERQFNVLPFQDELFTAEALNENVKQPSFFFAMYHSCVTLINFLQGVPSYVFCSSCNLAWPGWDCDTMEHPDHKGEPISFPGIYVQVAY